MSVIKHEFQNWDIRLGQKAKRFEGQTLNDGLVPAKFNCMCFINDTRSITGEDEDTSNVMSVSRSFNTVFEETYTLRGDYSIYDAINVPAKKNIKGGKKLFLDYGAV